MYSGEYYFINHIIFANIFNIYYKIGMHLLRDEYLSAFTLFVFNTRTIEVFRNFFPVARAKRYFLRDRRTGKDNAYGKHGQYRALKHDYVM